MLTALFITLMATGIWLGATLFLNKAPWPKETKQTLPSWFTKPYRDGMHCYGCGLDPWIMIPGKAIYCYGCWYLREEIESTPRVYEDFDEESWKASFKFHKHLPLPMGPAPGAHSSAGTVIITNSKAELREGGIEIQWNRSDTEKEFEQTVRRLQEIDVQFPESVLTDDYKKEWDRLLEKADRLKNGLR